MHFAWDIHTLSVEEIVGKYNPKKIVFFGPEEHRFKKILDSRKTYKNLVTFLNSKNIDYLFVNGACGDYALNYRFDFKKFGHKFVHWETFFAYSVYNVFQQSIGHNKKITKLFTSLNNRAHNFRKMFIDQMYNFDLFNHGYISWNNIDVETGYSFKYWKPEPMLLSDRTDAYTQDFFKLPTKEFKDSLFSLIAESTMDAIFTTEKTYIAILHRRPFLTFGAPSANLYMKTLGFKLFENVIDYSFDAVDDDTERCNLYMQQVKKLTTYNLNELKNEVMPIVNYNFDNFNEMIRNNSTVPEIVKDLVFNSTHNRLQGYAYLLNNNKKTFIIG
jgi:hypothetical protein